MLFKYSSRLIELSRQNTFRVIDSDKIYPVAGQNPGSVQGKIPFVAKTENLTKHRLTFCEPGMLMSGDLTHWESAGLFTGKVRDNNAAIFIKAPSSNSKIHSRFFFFNACGYGEQELHACGEALKVTIQDPKKAHIIIMVSNKNSSSLFSAYVDFLKHILGEHIVKAHIFLWETDWDNFAVILKDIIPGTPVGSFGHHPNPVAAYRELFQ